ncbi:MAG: hypothetical protein AB7F86_04745 [Bdellovibrionales bacterium]
MVRRSSLVICTALLSAMTLNTSLTGCTNQKKVKETKKERREAEEAQVRANQKEQEYEMKLKAAEKMAADNKKDREALSEEVRTWKAGQKDREAKLFSLNMSIAEQTDVLGKLQSEKEQLDKDIKAEREKIAVEKKALEVFKSQVDADKAALDAKAEALAKKEGELNERAINLQKTDERLVRLEAELEQARQKLTEDIQITREMFQREKLGDVFDKIQADKNFVFLVRVIGYGSEANVNAVRTKLDSMNASNSQYKALKETPALKPIQIKTKNGKLETANFVQSLDSFLIEAKAQDMKAVRDQVEAELDSKNRAGESSNLTSLWLVIRPVEQVRVGMKMVVMGSTNKYFDGRKAKVIATFDNIRSARQTVLGLDKLDLTKPGSYLFNNDQQIKACDSVNPECMKILVSEKMLDSVHSMDVSTAEGRKMESGSYRELLARMLSASINQSVSDLKEKTILGITTNKFDKVNWKFDYKALADKIGFADRAAVIDNVYVQYTVSMVEKVSHVTNHLDSIQFLSSGAIGDVKMIDMTERARGEISIPLPISQFVASKSIFKDLSLSDFKTKTQKPEKSQELKDIEAKSYFKRTSQEQSRMKTLQAEYEKAVEAAEAKIVEEKQSEFERRSVINAGILNLMIDALTAEQK